MSATSFTFMNSSLSKHKDAGPLGSGTVLTGSPVMLAATWTENQENSCHISLINIT